jgi:hypothetical protein
MRRFVWVAPLVVASCSMPPRTDDQSTPERTYETFRGAVARDEYDRAYATLSDQLRRKFGFRSRGDFTDAFVVGGGMAVSAIRRSKATAPVEPLKDGRALLRIRVKALIFGWDVRLWLRPVPVVRVWAEGSDSPVFYQHMGQLDVVREGGILGVRLEPELIEELKEGVQRGRIRRFQAGIEWFLDDFEVGKERERTE